MAFLKRMFIMVTLHENGIFLNPDGTICENPTLTEAEGNKIKGEHGKPFHIMDKLKADGLHVDQALVSGCAGGMFENLSAMADILDGCALPGNGQMAAAILMDARSIAATELDVNYIEREHDFDPTIYRNQVYDNAGKPDETVELRMDPNIASWPEMYPYAKHLLLRVTGAYEGSVTTDELVPSGDATAYRSNLINWGILPLLTAENPHLQVGDFVLIENVRDAIAADNAEITLRIWNDAGERTHTATLGGMTKEEKEILASGCFINYYRAE